MSPNQRNVLVGLVVLVALGVLTWMLLLFAGRATAMFVPRGMPITLTADRADGLNDGSVMFYRGVEVGKVNRIRRAPDNDHVIIQAEINQGQPPLPENLVGLIKTQGALSTSNSISLETQGPPSPDRLKPGQTIVARYVGFSFLPESVTDVLSDVRRQQVIKHLDETILAIRDQVQKAGLVLDSMQSVVADPKLREDLQASLANIRHFSGNLETISTNANSTVNDIRAGVGEVRATVASTNKHVDDLSRSLDGSIQKLGAVLEQLQSASAKINNGQGTAGMLLNDPRLYNSLTDTSKELNLTIADLRRVVQQWEQEGVPLKLK